MQNKTIKTGGKLEDSISSKQPFLLKFSFKLKSRLLTSDNKQQQQTPFKTDRQTRIFIYAKLLLEDEDILDVHVYASHSALANI